MRALSIRQPWAWAVLTAGKDVENREWERSPGLVAQARKLCGKRIAIHAGKTLDRAAVAVLQARYGLTVPADLPRGGYVGTVELVEVVAPGRSASHWAIPGQWGLVLAKPSVIPFIPAKGALGFFTPRLGFLDLVTLATDGEW